MIADELKKQFLELDSRSADVYQRYRANCEKIRRRRNQIDVLESRMREMERACGGNAESALLCQQITRLSMDLERVEEEKKVCTDCLWALHGDYTQLGDRARKQAAVDRQAAARMEAAANTAYGAAFREKLPGARRAIALLERISEYCRDRAAAIERILDEPAEKVYGAKRR